MAEDRVTDFNMDGFSSFTGSVFASLIYYLEVGYFGIGVVILNVVFVNCTGDMSIMFLYSIFQTSAGISCVRKVAIFFWA